MASRAFWASKLSGPHITSILARAFSNTEKPLRVMSACTARRGVWGTTRILSEDWVKRNPNATKALVKVLLKTEAYIRDPAHQDEVLKIYSDFQKQPLDMNKTLIDDYTFDPAVDKDYVEDMSAIADFLESTNRISNRRDALTYTYTEPMKAVDPSLVTVEGQWKP